MVVKKTILILSLISLITSVCGTAQAETLGGSTSSYVTNTIVRITQQMGQDSNVITFSEFPLDTYITDQYSNRGIIFEGDNPFITTDGVNPTSPVLSGTPKFEGAIEGRFVNPYDGITPIAVSSFSLDAGYFDGIETTRIEWFDRYDNKLGEQINSALGIEHFIIEGIGIAYWRFAIISSEPSGFAIDNVSIDDFDPLRLSKVDNVNDDDCVEPGDLITYTIDYNYPTGPNLPDINDVNIIDYLPDEVNYVSSDPCGFYDSNSRTVRWPIGTIQPGEANCVTLTVEVNCPEPGSTIINYCETKSGDEVRDIAYEHTPVCWRIIYADIDANGVNNGTSWQDAYNYLQNALQDANTSPGYKEIWVAAGTYRPDCNTDEPNGTGVRTAAFRLINGVKIKGGFSGYGAPDPNVRNTNWYKTILSGNIGAINNNNDNSYHVIITDSVDETAMLDGLTITAGNATDFFPYNIGGGMYNYNGSPVVTNCIFTENAADANGGGMCNKNSNPKITNCIFSGNLASYGGGISDFNSSPTMTNCTFTKNMANTNGGGICNNDSSPTIVNCILWGNTAPNNPQIYNYNNSSPIIAYSDIQDGLIGEWNPDTDADLKFNMDFEDSNNLDHYTQDSKLGLRGGVWDYNTGTPDCCNIFETTGKIGWDANFADRFDIGTGAIGDCKIIVPNSIPAPYFYGGDSNLATLGDISMKRTWAFWFNPMKNNQSGTFLRHAYYNTATSSGRDSWWEIRLSGGKLQFYQKNDKAGNGQSLEFHTVQSVSELSIDINEWHHAAFVIDRTDQAKTKIYVDGLEAPVTFGAFVNNPLNDASVDPYDESPLQIGKGEYEFDGRLDEIRLYHKALTPYQVSILFGPHNIDADPCFVDSVEDNYRLLSNSPCIDAGNNNYVPGDYADIDGDNNTTEPMPLDFDGFDRFIDGDCNDSIIVDMGAYEFLRSDIDHNGSVNFVDFANFAEHWRQTDCGECGGADLTCDGQVDFLDLRRFAEWWLAGTVF